MIEKKEKMIGFLLGNANPSIKRRVKNEILNNLTQREAAGYQEQILQEPNIRRCLACQLDNGWFGHGFHGTGKNVGQFENQETCTKYLGEKSVDKDTPALKRSMEAFTDMSLYNCDSGNEFKLAANGSNLIRCACIARARYADVIDISPQIQLFIPAMQKAVDEIMSYVDNDGICNLPVKYADLFKGWGPYGGLQLEVDWKSKIRKFCDITFRALLILHYSG